MMNTSNTFQKEEQELFEETVTHHQEISPGIYLLSVRRRFDFVPGQVVKLAVEHDAPPRLYSICSGAHDAELRILYHVKEGGYLTPRLAALIPGDKVLLSRPYGGFTGSKDPAWWIATGTGIAPFYSMFRSGLSVAKELIHGVSYLNQFYFEDELEEGLDKRYHRCCSREQACNVFPGRVTDYLQQLDSLPTDVRYYLCGQALMVVEVRDLLISRGVPYEHIIAEIYF